MKLIDSKGRVLLYVMRAEQSASGAVYFVYTRDGCGGTAGAVELRTLIQDFKRGKPGAREVGALPSVQLSI